MGTGFGVPFDKVYAMADISSILPNWEYHPHNAIFGLWMQLGSVGFALFLFFYSGVLVSASYAIRQASDAFGRSAAVFCVTALTSGLLVSNLDQFISTQRGGLFLGAVVGVVATISAMQGRTIALARHEHITEFATSK
jgi:O-antigen ligase